MGAFDWVSARRKCSLEQVFHTLREVLDSDVKSFNQGAPQGEQANIRLDATNKIIVGKTRDYGGITDGEGVVFELLPTEIRVKDARTSGKIFSARPSLDPEGDCLLQIEDNVYELWQVSRKALESLFFGSAG